MKQTVLFTPGRGEHLDDSRPYQDTLDTIGALGYNTRFIDIDWDGPTGAGIMADQVTDQVRSVYDMYDHREDVILAGFSFGALAALRAASEREPAAAWCFTLSPYYNEDMTPEFLAKLRGTYAPGELESYRAISFKALARKILCPVELFVGESDWPEVTNRAHAASEQLPAAHLTIAPGAGHDVTHPNYLQAISERLAAL